MSQSIERLRHSSIKREGGGRKREKERKREKDREVYKIMWTKKADVIEIVSWWPPMCGNCEKKSYAYWSLQNP